MNEEPSPRSGTPVTSANTENNPMSIPQPGSQLPTIPANDAAKPAAGSSFIPSWRRPVLNVLGNGQPAQDGRRPSVQFLPTARTNKSRSSSVQPAAARSKSFGDRAVVNGRRLSSPPPPAHFRPSVSFDTFSNPAASDFSLTLHRKHQDYVYTKRSRTFLCGTDTNEYSDTALEWLIDELVDDGDEVVCLRVVEKDSKEATRWAGGQGEKGYRDEAQRFLEAIERKNTDDRAISLVLEFSIGKVHDTIQQMIRIYEPAILVVGTRGRSLTGYHGLLSSGSISKYCLQYSPVPVIVVRPSSKREAKKRKRLQDPTRSGYRDILDKSEEHHRGRGGHLLDKSNRSSLFGPDLGALGEFNSAGDPDDEARRVAEAVGWHRGSRPGTASDGRSSSQTRQSAARAEASPAPNDRLLMSPDPNGRTSFGNSSPDSSESDDDDEANAPHHLRSQPHRRAPDEDEDYQDEDDDIVYEDLPLRPQDEAAIKAYEAGVRNAEDVREEAAAAAAKLKQQQDRSASRNGTRGRGRSEREEEGGGAAVLGLLAQLDRGMR